MSKLKKYLSLLLVVVMVLSVLPAGVFAAEVNHGIILSTTQWYEGREWMDSLKADTYTVSLRAKGSGNFRYGLKHDGGNYGYLDVTATADWQDYSVEITTTGGGYFALWGYEGTNVYIDDIIIKDGTGTTVYEWNFENGKTCSYAASGYKSDEGMWFATVGEVPEDSGSTETTGPVEPDVTEEPIVINHVLQFSEADWQQHAYYDVWGQINDGEEYTLSFKIKGKGTVRVGYNNWGNGPISEKYSVNSAEWETVTKTYTGNRQIDSGWAAMMIYRDPDDNGVDNTGTVYIDDISVRDSAGNAIGGKETFDFENGTNGWKSTDWSWTLIQVVEEPTLDPEDFENSGGTTEPSEPSEPSEPVIENHVLKMTSGDVVGKYVYNNNWVGGVTVGTEYTITFKVKGHGTLRAEFNQWGHGPAGSEINVQLDSDQWETKTSTFVAEDGYDLWSVMIFYLESTNAEIYVDDVSVVGNDGSSWVLNGDFENGMDKWNIDGITCEIVVDNTVPEDSEEPSNLLDVSDYRSGGTFTAPEEDGKVFAGWYTDAEFTTPLGSDVTTGNAYAKFVDADVLGVKWQLSAGTTAGSEKTNLRLLTSVDTLNYSQVGFVVDAGDGKVREPYTNTVYRKITGYVDETSQYYAPTIFSSASQYFMAYNYNNVPSSVFDTEIKVTPRWVTLDGTVVTGATETVVISSAFGG